MVLCKDAPPPLLKHKNKLYSDYNKIIKSGKKINKSLVSNKNKTKNEEIFKQNKKKLIIY